MLLGLLLALACTKDDGDVDYSDGSTDDSTVTNNADSGGALDQDGDGYTADEDCDDFDSNRNPGAEEDCDEVDNDCDEIVDEGAGDTWYADADGDGFGDEDAEGELACDEPADAADNNEDCDDDDSAVNPNQFEVCDGIDNDCDGEIDGESALDAETWYRDADYDTYGDSEDTTLACEEPSGYTDNDEDCDDSTSTTRPGADEDCDGEDNDCDGEVDEGEGAGDTFYADTDSDGYGDASDTIEACTAPSGYVDDDTDCDDDDADVHPGATEECDSEDDDCDGTVDEGATGSTAWYADSDSDGYGDASSTPLSQCEQPSGYVDDDTDCDDSDGDINPGADEECDSEDNDCDGDIDEDDAIDAETWYADDDLDGYGDSTDSTTACDEPSGYVDDDTDCDDTNADINPGADEECDAVDNDCDGDTDEDDAVDGTTYYADADGDGYGDSTSTTTACSVPSGYVSDNTDCDDTDSAINPAGTEACDGEDNDCDGTVDEGFSATPATWYADSDGDGYGDPDSDFTDCSTSAPSGYTSDDTDCDDGDADINPDADEECDSVDNDCDGETDEDDAIDASTWYADRDVDGYGDATDSTTACSEPTGYVSDDTDCDDSTSDVSPAESEVCDSVDNDCDGDTDEDDATDATDWYPDADSDGFGDDTATATTACDAPSGYVADNTDCDDSAGDVNPDEDEYCDSTDHDCDGDTEDGAVDTNNYFTDSDGDGYGDSTSGIESCSTLTGYASEGGDCDDSDSSVYPGADEYCDSVDNDCDGDTDEDDAVDATTYYADEDSDGYGDSAFSTTSCSTPTGYVSDGTDCDDADEDVNPGETEYCDGVDNDCDGDTDEDDAADTTDWYPDSDSDGYGDDTASATTACDAPSGYVSDNTDCDDSVDDVNPGEDEYCDTTDHDCDGDAEDGAVDATSYYTDSDGDGYGDDSTSTDSCSAVSGLTSTGGDCDDSDSAISPDATEYCDSVDNDCDDEVDEDDAADATTYYADADSDGYGDATSTTTACSTPSGYVSDATDCDDTDADVSPADTEYCDGVDNDCDGDTDEDDAADTTDWYPDSDSDGYGDDTASATTACDAPSGYVSDNTDCDDSVDDVNPGEDEYCDTTDHDCDGDAEDGAVDATSYYTDSDGDGYGDDSTSTDSCSAVSGLTSTGGDCDDSDSAISPDATEYCDSVDNDCDDEVDEDDAADASTYYADADSDGYGDATSTTTACSTPSGYVSDTTDCDDTDADVSPAATEYCDEVDNDCDGDTDEDDAADATDWYTDADSDGYGDDTATATAACSAPSGTVSDNTDCDDSADDVNPGADEYCDTTDHDCDGDTEDGAVDATSYYTDSDGDGYGDESTSTDSCSAVSGLTTVGGDCDDSDSGISPAETEYCDSVDNDCDDEVDEDDAADASTFYADDDGDGYGDSSSTTEACSVPSGYSTDSTDCDDTNGNTYEGASETCHDGDINDCSGTEADAIDACVLSGAEQATDFDEYIYGSTAGDELGAAIAIVADYNGDGYDEFLVGAPSDEEGSTDQGVVHLVYGPLATAVSSSSSNVVLKGESSSNEFGTAVVAADFDGDGDDDLAISAPEVTTPGGIYVLAGPVTADTQVNSGGRISGTGANADCGSQMAAPGDVDGDGTDDLLVSCWNYSTKKGRAHLVLGPISITSLSSSQASWDGAANKDYLGTGIGGIGDTNGDGYDDIAFGAPGYSSDGGAAWVVLGPVSAGGQGKTLSSTDGTVNGLSGSAGECGTSVGYAGDIDGDGYDDAFMGCPAGDRLNVYYGPLTGTLGPTSVAHSLTPSTGGVEFGAAAAALGDVDGDGNDDFAVSGPSASSSAGAVYLYWGPLSGSPGSDVSITGDTTAGFGNALLSAGDLDGDGYEDLFVGSSNADYDTYGVAGKAYLIPGADY